MSAPRPALFARCPASVRAVEVGPRDGLQNEPELVPAAVKVAFVEALAGAGHRHIEVASFVSPRRVPQLSDAEDVFRALRPREGVRYTALVPNEEGLRRALDAGVASIAVFTAASESFSQKNTGCSIAESLERIRKVVSRAAREGLRVRGYVSMAFSCPYEGPIAASRVLDVVDRLRALGVLEVSLGDTTGAAFPDQVARLLEDLAARHGGLAGFALHLHDTHRRALANALAGLLLGIEELDSSSGGLGGCPFAPGAKGNVATEDLVELLEGMGIATGIDLARQRDASAGIRAALAAAELKRRSTPGSPSGRAGGSRPGGR
ncbi:MAG: hydroxymethylglutaryl-CoA lyase [Planctomycetes bacterium]|nr:hydroxymethylglutaryl-CoA lyase [Planctomycetota bacterium]